VINKIKPLDQQLNILADGFMQLNINEVFLSPILRDFIDNRERQLFK